MKVTKKLPVLVLLAASFLMFACVYIVLPEGLEDPGSNGGAGTGVWSAFVTDVATTAAGDLHIDLTIRNNSGDWSTMRAAADKPATLETGGKSAPCETVFVSTGGHRLAPGFQMRGYSTGTLEAPETQTLYVECKGAAAAPGSKLSIDYESFNGILDDYDPEADMVEGVLELNLDDVTSGLTYPIGQPVDGLVQASGVNITGLSENVVTLLDIQRTETGFQFNWENFNPTKFPLKTHIGTPPVIGAQGILYGLYETLDMAETPITPANARVDWTTEVSVPADEKGFYILLSVESNKPRTYINYALDITDK